MFQFESLFLVLMVGGLAWLWYESRRAAEIVALVCQRTCRELDLQFLDQAVALSGLGIGRNSDGRLQLMRQFRFEFSTTGADRRQGRATMLGSRVESVLLDHPDGTTIITPQRAEVHRLN